MWAAHWASTAATVFQAPNTTREPWTEALGFHGRSVAAAAVPVHVLALGGGDGDGDGDGGGGVAVAVVVDG